MADLGRNDYTRHDYEEIDLSAANGLIDALRAKTATLPVKTFGAYKVEAADDFAYGYRSTGRRDVSGRADHVEGAAHRLPALKNGYRRRDAAGYVEDYEPPSGKLDQDT